MSFANSSMRFAFLVALIGFCMPVPSANSQDRDSAERARNGIFDVEETVPCAQNRGDPMRSCSAGVARGEDGEATVVVTFPNGFSRFLFFEDRALRSANATMSGSGKDVAWSLENGLHKVRVDDQRYELRDNFIFGLQTE